MTAETPIETTTIALGLDHRLVPQELRVQIKNLRVSRRWLIAHHGLAPRQAGRIAFMSGMI